MLRPPEVSYPTYRAARPVVDLNPALGVLSAALRESERAARPARPGTAACSRAKRGEGQMHTPPCRPRDEERVGVTLSPLQAREVARTLRIKLACELDRPFDQPLPSREDAARLRTVLDPCVDQLEALAWGEPSGDVRMVAPRLDRKSVV